MTGADATAIAPIRAALIVAAARERFLPVLTTTLGMAACLLPFVVPGELSGFEIDRPMALTILAGLATSTLFVLIAAPALAMIGGTGFKTAVDSGTT